MTTASTVEELLSAIDAESAKREDFSPSLNRDRAAKAIEAILWSYSARQGSTASVYAAVSLWEALGVDMQSLRFLDEMSVAEQPGRD